MKFIAVYLVSYLILGFIVSIACCRPGSGVTVKQFLKLMFGWIAYLYLRIKHGDKFYSKYLMP